MSNEERPRLSLRLRGLSPAGGPPEAPPDAPAPVPEAEPIAATPPTDFAAPPPLTRKPRLASLLATPAEQAPEVEPAVLSRAAEPPPIEAPAPVEPPPLPAEAYAQPAPFQPDPVAPPAARVGLPSRPSLNPANFPPPPGFKKSPPPAAPGQSRAPATEAPAAARKSTGTLLALLALVVGAGAYVYFLDPFGLFSHAAIAPPVAAQPVAIAPVMEPPPAPATEAPTAAEAAPAKEAVAAPTPSVPEPEPPPPPLPEITNAIAMLRISGARMNSQGGIMMVGTKVYNAGDIIDREQGIVFTGFANGTFSFRDERGATYQRRF